MVKSYDLYEMKNLTIEQLREGYRILTGLDDAEMTNEQVYNYMLDTLYEKEV